jgi:hypothetical protein
MAKWAVPNGPARSTARLIVPGRARHENRAVLGPLARPAVPARPGTIICFFILQNIIYIYLHFIFDIYNKCSQVLLVSLFQLVLLAC